MIIKSPEQANYEDAVHQNDLAQRNAICETINIGLEARLKEIEDEARSWLKHLDSIHFRR